MNKKPLISVAICTYNGEQFIRQQLDSILNQSYTPIEIIAVDDCSLDNSYSILCDYAAKYSNFTAVLNEQNLGYNKNFEKAINLCKGEFIAISDQDDIWLPEKLKVLYDEIGEYGLIYSNSRLIDKEGNDLGKLLETRRLYNGNDPRVFIADNTASGHTMLIKKNFISDFLVVPHNMVYDMWFAFVAANQNQLYAINDALTMHRIHDSNFMHTFKSKTKNDELVNIEHVLKGVLTLKTLRHRRFFEKFYNRIINRNKSIIGNICFKIFFVLHAKTIFFLHGRSRLSSMNQARKFYI